MLIAGVDEAGRGPLAGPVYAAAVVLDENNPILGLKDSKLLSAVERNRLSQEIYEKALDWKIAKVEVEEIDRINILQATLLAMKQAIEGLKIQVEEVLVDGNVTPKVALPIRAIIKGDLKIKAISAASILAKCARDQEMIDLDKIYRGYAFARNKGYPSKEHLEALQKLGVCSIHRKTYAPVRKVLEAKLEMSQS